MKGSLKRIHDHLKNRTNFNDWSDPKYEQSYYKSDSEFISGNSDTETPIIPKDTIISQTTNEIEDIKRNVKAGHPLLSLKEVRNFRLPFYEGLLSNLLEDGFIGSYHFIKDLIDLDDNWHKSTHENYPVKKRAHLKSCEHALHILSDGLVTAEKANREGNKADELSCLLDLALNFTKMDCDLWYWLSEELYEQCIHITNLVELPTEYDNELTAILKHLYAEFLLDNLHEPERAKCLVEESMELSKGKFFNTSVLTGDMKDSLYSESCILIHRILLTIADENRVSNIEHAIQLYKDSLHWSKVVNNKVAEMTVLLHLIDTYIVAKQLDKIPHFLENYLKLCTEQSNISAICEGYILSAKYHSLTEEHDLEYEDLQTLLKTAEENNLLEIVAVAHYKLAVFYLLHRNKKDIAESHASEAYYGYLNLNIKHKIEATTCLIGVCQGKRILPHYIRLLSKSDKAGSNDLKTLMKWHTLRIPFFPDIKVLQIESEQNVCLQNEMEYLRNNELVDTELENDKIKLTSFISLRKSKYSQHSRLSKLSSL